MQGEIGVLVLADPNREHVQLGLQYVLFFRNALPDQLDIGRLARPLSGPRHQGDRRISTQRDRGAPLPLVIGARGPIAESRARLLDRIEGWLDSSDADELAEWSHVYLAHAGSAENRKALAEAIITNDRITGVTRMLARVTEA